MGIYSIFGHDHLLIAESLLAKNRIDTYLAGRYVDFRSKPLVQKNFYNQQ